MGLPATVIIASGQTQSDALVVTRPLGALTIAVPSIDAGEVRVQFGTASGTGFADVIRADGSGVPFSVYSGAGPAFGVVTTLVSPWSRLTCSTAQTSPRSFVVSALLR